MLTTQRVSTHIFGRSSRKAFHNFKQHAFLSSITPESSSEEVRSFLSSDIIFKPLQPALEDFNGKQLLSLSQKHFNHVFHGSDSAGHRSKAIILFNALHPSAVTKKSGSCLLC
jgi:hypothetical protein